MFVAGLGLFFGGIAVAAYRAYRVIAKERIVAMTAIALVAIFGSSLDGVVLLIVVDVILLVTLLAEHRRIESPTEEAESAGVAA